jgi:hypothetical protein
MPHAVTGQIFGREQAAAFLDILDQLLRDGAAVEVVGIGCNRPQRCGEFRLLEGLARPIEFAVALKDALRFGKLRQGLVLQDLRLFIGEHVALAGQPDCGRHYLT